MKLQLLRVFSIVGAFIVGFWLPIRLIGYVPPVWLEVSFDILISCVAAVNIYFYFSEADKDYRSKSDWLNLGLALDLICLMPLSLFAFTIFDSSPEWILILNLFAARHIRHIKPFLDEFDSLAPLMYRLIPLLTGLPILVHIIACGWIALGSGSSGPDADPIAQYIKAIYWSFTTLTTVGYGDIVAKTNMQMLYAASIQVIGVGVFGYILSNVASLISRSDAAREHHMDNLDRIETFMKMHRAPGELKSKIRSYYNYLWLNKKGYQDQSLLEGLPAKIQSELFFFINRSIIEKVPFFRGASVDLLEDLMTKLDSRIYVPDEKIFKHGEAGDALYFIHSGQVDILDSKGEKIVALQEGSFFGEMALVSDIPRSATARANTYCDLYLLHKSAFEEVTRVYPEFKKHIEDVVQRRKSA
jgi:Cyclic nucleotide-binding domain/Ion channel